MQLYRFSPIEYKASLMQAIRHIHIQCHVLCKQTFGKYLPVVGDIGVFAHYENEFSLLKEAQSELTETANPYNGKYFKLLAPITIDASVSVPAATYTHLYVRQPDPYRSQVGDIDFYMPKDEFIDLCARIKRGESLPGARLFERPDLKMIELYNPDIDVLGYINPIQLS